MDPCLFLRDWELSESYSMNKVLYYIIRSVRFANKDLSKLSLYLELPQDEDEWTRLERARLERESALVRQVKPMLAQRSFSMGELTKVDLSVFSEEEKKECLAIISREEAKVEEFL